MYEEINFRRNRVKRFNLLIAIVFVLLLTIGCSPDDSEKILRGSSFGDRIDNVIAQEKEQGNVEYEKESSADYTTLTYRDVVENEQEALLVTYAFYEDFNGETHDEQVLGDMHYIFENDSFNEKKFISDMNEKHGEENVEEVSEGKQWTVGESRIILSVGLDVSLVMYFHESDSRVQDPINDD